MDFSVVTCNSGIHDYNIKEVGYQRDYFKALRRSWGAAWCTKVECSTFGYKIISMYITSNDHIYFINEFIRQYSLACSLIPDAVLHGIGTW